MQSWPLLSRLQGPAGNKKIWKMGEKNLEVKKNLSEKKIL